MAVWTASLIPSLPVDVLHLVGLVAHPSDLSSMVRVNKALNKTLTPILYSNIELDAWDPILQCIKTLDSQSRQRSFGRVLAAYVRSLVLTRPLSRKPGYAGGIGDALHRVLPLMTKLKHFSSGIGLSPCSSNIFYLLATGSCPSLQSMELQVIGEVPTALERTDPDTIESSPLTAPPHLQRLTLEVPIGSAAQRSLVRHLLRTCAPTLTALSLTIDGRYLSGIWEHFLPSHDDAHFARLEDLAIESDALLLAHPAPAPLLQRAPRVRSLRLLDKRSSSSSSARRRLSLSPDALPHLCAISCPAGTLAAFLPANAPPPHRRPVATVCLGRASYRSSGDEDGWNRQDPARWRDVYAALQHLRYSAVPVTSLTIDVLAVEVGGVRVAQPYLATLEHLDVVLHRWYDPDALSLLARELLTHLPRLHTLLISQAFRPTGAGRSRVLPLFGEEALELGLGEVLRLSRAVLRELGDRPGTALRRFALSAKVEWHKKKDEDGGGDGDGSGDGSGRWYWVADPREYGGLCGSLDGPPAFGDGSGSSISISKSEAESEAADESEGEGEDSGYGEDETGTVCVDSGYEDEGEGEDTDDESEGETQEDTRPLLLDVWADDDDDGGRYLHVG